ncbi:MAG TPA: FemAB family XrtA/PEP-CTERM system-associated protein [Vicinamibacterales bacterium]
MNVRLTGPEDAARWNRFIKCSPDGSFYHRYEWKRINEEHFGHRTAYLAAFSNGEIVGVLPLVQLKSRLFGNIACSMPFVNYGGPCASDPEVERALLDEARRQVEDWKADYLEIRSRRPLPSDLPSSTHKVSLTVKLDPDPEVLFKAFKTGHRQDIRRAYKNGVTARFGGIELVDPFYEIISQSWRALGTPLYAKNYFRMIAEAFGDAIRICVVYVGDQPAAAAFDGIHNRTVEGMWLGIRSEYRKLLVGYALYWELVRHACVAGYAEFHLGRSSADSNAEAFKKKWNATSSPLYWTYLLRSRQDIPQLNVANPKYQLAMAVWRRLPLPITNAIGPFIARSIP